VNYRERYEGDDEIIDQKMRLSLEDGGWTTGELPHGYELWFQGKMITYFMEDHRINEILLPVGINFDNILHQLSEEIRLIQAQGLRIENPNPMSIRSKQELVDLIKAVKAEFGNDFYTQIVLNDVDLNVFLTDQLAEANLDELILHLELSTIKNIKSFESAIEYIFKVGIEVSIPENLQNGTQLENLADYLGSIDMNFLTLRAPKNDLKIREIADHLIQSSGSIENLPIIYLPLKLWKDETCRRRYIIRATAIRRPFEEITPNGLLRALRIEGNVLDIKNIQSELEQQLKITNKMRDLSFNEHILDLSPIWAENPKFKNILANYSVRAGIIEFIPFREVDSVENQNYLPLQDQISNYHRQFSRKKEII
jgi:pyruvate formate-lyase activating enzyme-like uncharacterized protein